MLATSCLSDGEVIATTSTPNPFIQDFGMHASSFMIFRAFVRTHKFMPQNWRTQKTIKNQTLVSSSDSWSACTQHVYTKSFFLLFWWLSEIIYKKVLPSPTSTTRTRDWDTCGEMPLLRADFCQLQWTTAALCCSTSTKPSLCHSWVCIPKKIYYLSL